MRGVWRQGVRLGQRLNIDETPVADARLDPEEALLRFELVQAVHNGIAALGPEGRAVIVLVDLEGLSGQAAALALGISIPALKARLHRARSALREQLMAAPLPLSSTPPPHQWH